MLNPRAEPSCLRLLALILCVWEPLNLAVFLSPAVASIGTRGYAAAALIAIRLFVSALGVAAGIALWRRSPHGRSLAITALVFSTAATIATLTTTILPTNIMPGDRWLWLALVVAFNGGWVVYLWVQVHDEGS